MTIHTEEVRLVQEMRETYWQNRCLPYIIVLLLYTVHAKSFESLHETAQFYNDDIMISDFINLRHL